MKVPVLPQAVKGSNTLGKLAKGETPKVVFNKAKRPAVKVSAFRRGGMAKGKRGC